MVKDWTKIQKKYKGLWVAFAKDEKTVMGSGKTGLDENTKEIQGSLGSLCEGREDRYGQWEDSSPSN